VVDLHAEAQFDLTQVFVERPAQVGEAGVVLGVEGEVALIEAVGLGISVFGFWLLPLLTGGGWEGVRF
jgi:hypothetical protein